LYKLEGHINNKGYLNVSGIIGQLEKFQV